jgi:hypothetical protein
LARATHRAVKAIHLHEFVDRHHKRLVISLSDHILRIPTKAAMHFDLKRATCSDPKPAGFTSDVSHPAALSADRGMIFCFGCWVKRVVSSMRRLQTALAQFTSHKNCHPSSACIFHEK